MSAFAAVNGVQVFRGSLTIPYYGQWVADFDLSTTDAQAAAASVTVGNLSLIGTAYRTAPFAGARGWRGAAGFGGWRKLLKAVAYGSTTVMLSMVLGDAASQLGEKVLVSPDQALGPGWSILGTQTGAQLLYQCAGPLWYVDNAGTTQVTASRPSAAITSDFEVIDDHSGKGLFEVSTEDYASWMPGNTFTAPTVTGTVTISSTTFRVDNEGKLRLSVLGDGAAVQ